jgi:hypothetical protein
MTHVICFGAFPEPRAIDASMLRADCTLDSAAERSFPIVCRSACAKSSIPREAALRANGLSGCRSKYADWILQEQRIGCHDLQVVPQRLTDQHAIERIAVMER